MRNLIVFITLLTSISFGQLLSIQGVARDNSGASLSDGDYNFVFRLYVEETGGTAAWSEPQLLNVVNGVFSTNLGAVTSMDGLDFNTQYWMSLEISNNGELSPRTKLTLTPYAIMAQLDGATNIIPSDGNVGIGTTSPDRKLTVEGTARLRQALYMTDANGDKGFVFNSRHGNDYDYLSIYPIIDGSGEIPKGFMLKDGNFGIGMWNPKQKLDASAGHIYLGQGNIANVNKGKITWNVDDNNQMIDSHWLGYDNNWWLRYKTYKQYGFVIETENDGEIFTVGGATNTKTGTGTGVKINGDLNMDNGYIESDGLSHWRLIHLDTFEEGNDGWTGAMSGNGTSNCGGAAGYEIYGGVDQASRDEFLVREFTVPSETKMIKIEMQVLAIDSWNKEYFWITKLDNWKRNTTAYMSANIEHMNFGINLCGLSNFTDKVYTVTFIGEYDGSGNPKFHVGTSLDDNGASAESFGVDNVHIWVSK
jgi:hypothetical protein